MKGLNINILHPKLPAKGGIQSYVVVVLFSQWTDPWLKDWNMHGDCRGQLSWNYSYAYCISAYTTTPCPLPSHRPLRALSPSPLPEFKRTPPRKMLLEKASLSQMVSSRQTFIISWGCRPLNMKVWFHWGLILFFITRVLCLVALLSSGSR